MNGNPGEKWDHSPEAKRAIAMTEAPISLDAIFRGEMLRERLNVGRKFGPIYIFYTRIVHTHRPPSLFALLVRHCYRVGIINGRVAPRLMPAGHDCAAITRSSGMTKMSKRKIMVRKSGAGRRVGRGYRRNWWSKIRGKWMMNRN